MKKRVVITGMGAITPVGNSVTEFWDSIRAGRVGIGPITKFDTSEYKVKIAAEVKDFQAKDHMDFKAAKRMEPFSQYAVAAAKEAFADAGIDMERRSVPCGSDGWIRNRKSAGRGARVYKDYGKGSFESQSIDGSADDF